MKFSKSLILILSLALVAIPALAQMDVEHKKACSVATLRGTYGVIEEGTVLAQFPGLPAPPYPVVLTGTITYYGDGNVTGIYTSSLGGVIVPGTGSGRYEVTADCRYSDAITEPNGPGGHHVGTITGEGMFQEIHTIYTDSWLVASSSFRKTPPRGCSQETVRGPYALFGQGWWGPNGAPLLLGAHAGMFVADGRGNLVDGQEMVNIDGTSKPDTFTATYTVDPNCAFSAWVSVPSGVVPLVGMITGEGRFQEIHTIMSDSGWVFANTFKKKR